MLHTDSSENLRKIVNLVTFFMESLRFSAKILPQKMFHNFASCNCVMVPYLAWLMVPLLHLTSVPLCVFSPSMFCSNPLVLPRANENEGLYGGEVAEFTKPPPMAWCLGGEMEAER